MLFASQAEGDFMNASNTGTSRRTIVPRLLNFLLWLSFCSMAGTGLLLAFRLPRGSQGGHGLQAMGLGRHTWGDVHTYISYVFMFLIVMHLAFHWRWLWQVAARRRSWPMLAGFGAGAGLMLWLALQPVHSREEKKHERAGHQQVEKREDL